MDYKKILFPALAVVGVMLLYRRRCLNIQDALKLEEPLKDVCLEEDQLKSLMRLILNEWLKPMGYTVENLRQEGKDTFSLSGETKRVFEEAVAKKSTLPLYNYFVRDSYSQFLNNATWDDFVVGVLVLGIPESGNIVGEIGLYDVRIGNKNIGPFLGEEAPKNTQFLSHAVNIIKLTDTNVVFNILPDAPLDFIEQIEQVFEGSGVEFIQQSVLE